MVKINPNFEMSISESFVANLWYIINKMERYPERDPNQIILDEIEEFYDRKKEQGKHSFDDVLINFLKKDFILPIIKINGGYLENVNQAVMDKLIDFFLNYFYCHGYQKFKHHLIVSDEEYVREEWGVEFLSKINHLKTSPDLLLKLEKKLKEQLKDDWDQIDLIWNDFKEDKIDSTKMIKQWIEIFEENKLYNIIKQFFTKQ